MKTRIIQSVFFLMLIFLRNTLQAQTVVKMQNGYGIMSWNNEMLIENCQSISQESTRAGDVFIIKKNDRFAIHVEEQKSSYRKDYLYYYYSSSNEKREAEKSVDWNNLVFEYDTVWAIESTNKEIDFVVKKNQLFGAINSSNHITLPIIYDSIFSTKASVFLTIAKKEGKFAIVPNILIGEFSSNLLNFQYDQISKVTKDKNVVRLKKGTRFAFAFSTINREIVLSPAIFDSVVSKHDFFLKSTLNDTVVFLYSSSSYSDEHYSYMTLNMLDNTVFYDISTNQRIVANLDAGEYIVDIFFPNAYFESSKNAKISILDLKKSLITAKEDDSNIKILNLTDLYYLRSYSRDFVLQNKMDFDFVNVGTIYRMKDFQKLFSYPIDSKIETLELSVYEKDTDYLVISLVTLSNGKSKTLGYLHHAFNDSVSFSSKKPDNDYSISLSSGGGGGLNLMDFLWMGGR